jgi:hypothetical protein
LIHSYDGTYFFYKNRYLLVYNAINGELKKSFRYQLNFLEEVVSATKHLFLLRDHKKCRILNITGYPLLRETPIQYREGLTFIKGRP